MNDSETDSQSIKALIVFRENGETDNLFVPILCDAIRMAGIDVRCSQKEFWVLICNQLLSIQSLQMMLLSTVHQTFCLMLIQDQKKLIRLLQIT